jgi:hypothetical protein
MVSEGSKIAFDSSFFDHATAFFSFMYVDRILTKKSQNSSSVFSP